MLQRHTFSPVFNDKSKVLILGTLPSAKSRENGFYYGHPQNRFWKVLAAIFHCPVPESREEKISLLLTHGIALWDVVKQCDIELSSDSSIRRAEPNDIGMLLKKCPIKAIYANGKTAERLYNKLLLPLTGRNIIVLPSTSPANASINLEALIAAWQVIAQAVQTTT